MPDLSVELRHGTPRHRRILRAIEERYEMSRRTMTKRHEKWDEADELFRAYIKEDDEARTRSSKRKQGTPQYTTLEIPYSYALLLAAHTYWSSVFLARNPVFQYSGRHGEAQMKVQAVEALIDYQRLVGEMNVPLYVWLLDAGKYGIGVLGNYWAEETQRVSQVIEVRRVFGGIPLIGGKKKRKRVWKDVSTYKGNRIFNVRPHDFFPDPRVSLLNFQKGEFCGRLTPVGWNTILRGKATGEYFNVDALRRVLKTGSSERVAGSAQVDLPDVEMEDTTLTSEESGMPELLEMVIELSPMAEPWKLGKTDFPEKWAFTVANREVIIGARPLGAVHGRYPYEILSYEVEGHAAISRGMMEIVKPLNDTLTFLFNQHLFNVRKVINDQLVVDQSRVEMRDLTEGGPGRIIRLRPAAYGTDVRQAIHQLPVVDVTGGHIKDAMSVIEMMQRATGVTDNVMGAVNPGGRKTATEVRSAGNFSINRLKTFAEFNSSLGFQPLSSVLVQNTQFRYDEEQVFRVAGSLASQAPEFLSVNPEDIAGFYNFVPVDGTLPIDRFAQAQLWKEVLEGLGQMPQIATRYDIAGIFSWMAQLAGLKNIDQFAVQVTPDEQLAAQEQAGNLVPIAGAGA
jgi:hypothetical protein